jgi:hypothetical protein
MNWVGVDSPIDNKQRRTNASFVVRLPPVATSPKSDVLLVSQVKWVGRTHPWTTDNDERIHCSSFGCDVAESDVATGVVCGG